MKKCILCLMLLLSVSMSGFAQGGENMEIVITKENFKQEVLESKLPVLVDFFATWCGPCKMLAPTLEEFANENAGKIVVGKCDIDQQQELANEYKIEVVPTLIAFKNGRQINITRGLCSKKQLADLFKEE